LVDVYRKELEMLGVLRFEIVLHGITEKGGQPKKIYYLNNLGFKEILPGRKELE
jgi:hypothetical protein